MSAFRDILAGYTALFVRSRPRPTTVDDLVCPRCRTAWPCQPATEAVERIAARHPGYGKGRP